ncbi:unnamed protein product [Aphanomyces euteiches]
MKVCFAVAALAPVAVFGVPSSQNGYGATPAPVYDDYGDYDDSQDYNDYEDDYDSPPTYAPTTRRPRPAGYARPTTRPPTNYDDSPEYDDYYEPTTAAPSYSYSTTKRPRYGYAAPTTTKKPTPKPKPTTTKGPPPGQFEFKQFWNTQAFCDAELALVECLLDCNVIQDFATTERAAHCVDVFTSALCSKATPVEGYSTGRVNVAARSCKDDATVAALYKIADVQRATIGGDATPVNLFLADNPDSFTLVKSAIASQALVDYGDCVASSVLNFADTCNAQKYFGDEASECLNSILKKCTNNEWEEYDNLAENNYRIELPLSEVLSQGTVWTDPELHNGTWTNASNAIQPHHPSEAELLGRLIQGSSDISTKATKVSYSSKGHAINTASLVVRPNFYTTINQRLNPNYTAVVEGDPNRVLLCSSAFYGGTCQSFTVGNYNFVSSISSIFVPTGYRLTLFPLTNQGGVGIPIVANLTVTIPASLTLTRSIRIEVFDPLIVYLSANFGGTPTTLPVGNSNLDAPQLSAVSSLRIVPPYFVTVHNQLGQQGSSNSYIAQTNLVGSAWDNQIQSVSVQLIGANFVFLLSLIPFPVGNTNAAAGSTIPGAVVIPTVGYQVTLYTGYNQQGNSLVVQTLTPLLGTPFINNVRSISIEPLVVYIFAGNGFVGNRVGFTTGSFNIDPSALPTVASLTILPYYRVILHSQPNQQGNSVTIISSTTWLGATWTNNVRSITVVPLLIPLPAILPTDSNVGLQAADLIDLPGFPLSDLAFHFPAQDYDPVTKTWSPKTYSAGNSSQFPGGTPYDPITPPKGIRDTCEHFYTLSLIAFFAGVDTGDYCYSIDKYTVEFVESGEVQDLSYTPVTPTGNKCSSPTRFADFGQTTQIAYSAITTFNTPNTPNATLLNASNTLLYSQAWILASNTPDECAPAYTVSWPDPSYCPRHLARFRMHTRCCRSFANVLEQQNAKAKKKTKLKPGQYSPTIPAVCPGDADIEYTAIVYSESDKGDLTPNADADVPLVYNREGYISKILHQHAFVAGAAQNLTSAQYSAFIAALNFFNCDDSLLATVKSLRFKWDDASKSAWLDHLGPKPPRPAPSSYLDQNDWCKNALTGVSINWGRIIPLEPNPDTCYNPSCLASRYVDCSEQATTKSSDAYHAHNRYIPPYQATYRSLVAVEDTPTNWLLLSSAGFAAGLAVIALAQVALQQIRSRSSADAVPYHQMM